MLTRRQAHYPVEKAEPHRKVAGAHGPPAHRQHLQGLPSKAEAAIQGVPNAGTTHTCTLSGYFYSSHNYKRQHFLELEHTLGGFGTWLLITGK